MGDSGGTTEITLRCARDNAATRLRCAECQAPICPACFVRTPVGLRCPDCAVASGPPVRAESARPRWLVPAVVAVLVAVGVASAATLSGGGGEEPAPAIGEPVARTPAGERVRLGTGELSLGRWVLEGRRSEGAICGTLALEPSSSPGQERCHPLPGDRAILTPISVRIRTRSETLYLTHGPVSERTARVRVAPEGSTPWEVPALGAGMDLGGRFFVVLTPTSRTTFTALDADGNELGRTDLVPPPGS